MRSKKLIQAFSFAFLNYETRVLNHVKLKIDKIKTRLVKKRVVAG